MLFLALTRSLGCLFLFSFYNTIKLNPDPGPALVFELKLSSEDNGPVHPAPTCLHNIPLVSYKASNTGTLDHKTRKQAQ